MWESFESLIYENLKFRFGAYVCSGHYSQTVHVMISCIIQYLRVLEFVHSKMPLFLVGFTIELDGRIAWEGNSYKKSNFWPDVQ